MAVKKEYTYPSRDGVTQIHAYTWAPDDGNVRAIFQIVHGMVESMERYDDFACFLTDKGFLVVGNDHLGHGKTAVNGKGFGYFAKENADVILVRDVHRLKKITEEQYPGIPYFIMGHSMGSFIFRKYMTMYGKGIDGAIVMGTGYMPAYMTGGGIILCKILKLFYGERHVSNLVYKLAFGAYNKRIENPATPSDWLSTDAAVVDAYCNNPMCQFRFTLNGYITLFTLISYVNKKKNLLTIPKDLPVYITSGNEDPVGNYGKSPKKIYDIFKSLGIKDVEIKMYDNYRHEPLNEAGHEKVYENILNWLEKHV